MYNLFCFYLHRYTPIRVILFKSIQFTQKINRDSSSDWGRGDFSRPKGRLKLPLPMFIRELRVAYPFGGRQGDESAM